MDKNDITQTGAKPLKGLPGVNRVSNSDYGSNLLAQREKQEAFESGIKGAASYKQFKDVYNRTASMDDQRRLQTINPNSPIITDYSEQAMEAGYGESTYDSNIYSPSQLNNLSDFRGEEQSGALQLLNGVTKGVITATTTFVGSTLGILYGIGSVASGGSFWDNDLNQGLNNILKWSEEAIPNYYTEEEKENAWYENIFTANFIGDKFLKNVGFSVGAAAAGILVGGGVAAGISRLVSNVKLGSVLTRSLAGAVMSSGEANIEALNAADEFKELNAQFVEKNYAREKDTLDKSIVDRFEVLKDLPDRLVPSEYDAEGKPLAYRSQKELSLETLRKEHQAGMTQLDIKREAQLAEAEKLRTKTGNAVFGANMALLMTSNNIQVGNLINGGFKNARRGLGVVKSLKNNSTKLGKESVEEGTEALIEGNLKAGARAGYNATVAGKTVVNALSEGLEESGQNIASNAAQLKYSSDLNTFSGQKINPYVQDEVNGFMTATLQAMEENFGTIDAPGWEEFFLGFITGAPGMPTVGKKKNGKTGVVWAGGIKEAREEADQLYKGNEFVDIINKRMEDPKFLALYQGLSRHKSYDNLLQEATEENNKLAYKNTEESQLVSDLLLFRNAGMLDEYLGMLKQYSAFSSEDVDGLKKATTLEKEGVSLKDGRSEEDVAEDVASRAKQYYDDAQEIIKIHDNNLVQNGDKFTKEGLEELTYLAYKARSSEKRGKGAFKNFQEAMKPIVNSLSNKKFKVGENIIDVSELLEKSPESFANELLKENSELAKITLDIANINYDRYKHSLSSLQQLEATRKESGSTKDDLFSAGIKAAQKAIKEIESKGLTTDPEEIATNLNDAMILFKLGQVYKTKLVNALADPTSLQGLIDQDTAKAVEEEVIKEDIKNYNALEEAVDFKDLRDKSNQIPTEVRIQALDRFAQENAGTFVSVEARELANMNRKAKALTSMLNRDDFQEEDSQLRSDLVDAVDESLRNTSDEDSFIESLLQKSLQNPVLARALQELAEFEAASSEAKDDLIIPKEPIGNNPDKALPIEKADAPKEELKSEDDAPLSVINPENSPREFNDQKTLEEVNSHKEAINKAVEAELSIDGVTEASIFDLADTGLYIPQKEKDTKYTTMWNKFNSLGVFEFINSGKLAEVFNKDTETKVYFIVDKNFNNLDPLFEKVVFTAIKVDTPTAIKIGDSFYQIIGSVKNKVYDKAQKISVENKVATAIINDTLEQSSTTSNEESFSISNTTTTIKRINPGRMVLATKEIPFGEKDVTNTNAKLGVIADKQFHSPLTGDNTLSPKDIDKQGTVYMMIKMSNGKWLPTRVGVKRFSNEEYPYTNTPIYSIIVESLNNLLIGLQQGATDSQLLPFRDKLETVLYFGKTDAINENKRNSPYRLVFQKTGSEAFLSIGRKIGKDEEGKNQYDNKGPKLQITAETTLEEVVNWVKSFNFRFQVNSRTINDPNYNKRLVESKILTTNLADQTNFRNAQVVINNPWDTKPPKKKEIKAAPFKEPTKERLVIVNEETYKFIDIDGVSSIVRDSEGKLVNTTLKQLIITKKIIEDGAFIGTPYKGNESYLYKIPNGTSFYGALVNIATKEVTIITKEKFSELEEIFNKKLAPTISENSPSPSISSTKESVEVLNPIQEFKKNGFNPLLHTIDFEGGIITVTDKITEGVIKIFEASEEISKDLLDSYSKVEALNSEENKEERSKELQKLKVIFHKITNPVVEATSSQSQTKKVTTNNNSARAALAGTLEKQNDLLKVLDNTEKVSIFASFSREEKMAVRDALAKQGINVKTATQIEAAAREFLSEIVLLESFTNAEDLINEIKCTSIVNSL